MFTARIKDWPKGERPREKLIRKGSDSLSDAELLAILLRNGSRDGTAVDVAKSILSFNGSLERLASRSFGELRRHRGMGEVKAVTVLAAFELGRRSAVRTGGGRTPVRSPQAVARIFQPLFRDLKQEVCKVLLLDSANHLLRDVKISEGILNSSLVHPREVFRQAIIEPAASVILLHNHPSGNPEPSSEDLQITRQLVEAGKIMGIPVHDHIIIASTSFTSFAERGLI